MICKLYLHKALQKKKRKTPETSGQVELEGLSHLLDCAGPDPPLLGPGDALSTDPELTCFLFLT